jgi:heme/copper-type cytochrome/quinol oxidase subunit 3
MSPVYLEPTHPTPEHAGPPVRLVDDKRGTWGVALFIATEAMLFVMLFFTYFYVEKGNQRWSVEEPPKLHYVLPMLAVLLASSAVLRWGEKQVKKERYGAGRAALIGTIVLAVVFLGLSYLDYSEHLLHLTPRTNAYGSIFYTITSVHVAHLLLGLFMLLWVLLLARRWEPTQHTPYRPYHNAAMYWHFVDTVWIFIVAILYVAPNVYNAL